MVQITSLVMVKMQQPFSNFKYGSFLLPWQPNQGTDYHNFTIFKSPYPSNKQSSQIRNKLLQWLWRSCRLKVLKKERTDKGQKVIIRAHPEHSSG